MPYIHLTEQERYVISHLTCAGFSLREIGRRINRNHATFSRELKRNGTEVPPLEKSRPAPLVFTTEDPTTNCFMDFLSRDAF